MDSPGAGSVLRGHLFTPLVSLLWRADKRLVLWYAGITLALGLLPNLIVLATGNVASAAAAVEATGLGSASGHRAMLALGLLGLGFAAMGVFVAIARWVTVLLNTRYVDRVFTDVARIWLGPRFLGDLDDPSLASAIGAVGEFERSGLHMQAVPALRMVVSRRISGVGAAVLLFALCWWAPLVLAVGWWAVGWGSNRWMDRGFSAAAQAGQGGLRLPTTSAVWRCEVVRPRR